MRAALLAAIVSLCTPSAAAAATAQIVTTECDPHYGCLYYPDYRASPGERNDVTVSAAYRGFVIHDDGAQIEAGSGCSSRSPHEVACTSLTCATCDQDLLPPHLELGDGDDRARGSTGFDVDGGPGDDVLSSPSGFIGGGGGHDTLIGGDGSNVLADGDGVNGAPVDEDVIDGGGGNDVVSYAGRSTPVEFTPGTGSAGAGGTEDRVTNVEGVTGGEGDDRLQGNPLAGNGGNDVLIGTPGDDSISGGPGDDVLVGGPGNDRLDPGTGADQIDGGRGNDKMYPSVVERDAKPNRWLCGPGFDEVSTPGTLIEYVAPDCENVWPENVLSHALRQLLPLRSLRGGIVTHEEDCSPGSCPWSLSVRVEATGELLGRRAMARTRHRFPRMTLRLSARGRAVLRRRGQIGVVIAVCERLSGHCGRYATTLASP